MERDKNMEMAETVQLTKEQNLMELVELLRKHNMKEAANSIFEMAAYVDVMEKKMDSVLEELRTVKKQLHKMEEREAEKGLKQTLKRAVSKLEQDCHTMKERLFEVKAEIRSKAGEIVTAAKQKGNKKCDCKERKETIEKGAVALNFKQPRYFIHLYVFGE